MAQLVLLALVVVAGAFATTADDGHGHQKEGTVAPATACSQHWSPTNTFETFEKLIRKSGYQKDVCPHKHNNNNAVPVPDSPTEVKINFFVNNIDSVDEVNGKFTVLLYFRQKWMDPRLAYDTCPQFQNQCEGNKPEKLNLPDSMVPEIYQPDLFIPQELEGRRHGLFHADRFVKVYPNGTVLLSRRISMTLSCPQLANPRLMLKECDMRIESYGHISNEMALDWMDGTPTQVDKDIFVPKRYRLEEVKPLRCDDGTYSCIKGRFIFTRGQRRMPMPLP